MNRFENQQYDGERPFYNTRDIELVNVTIGVGESAIKETDNVIAEGCTFLGRYPFWCNKDVKINNCTFGDDARAALWYSTDLEITNTVFDSPKALRELDGIRMSNCKVNNAIEYFWFCRNIELDNVELRNGDYLFLHSENIRIRNFHFQGKYSFQYCKNIVIEDSILDTKDAFWNTENVTLRNCQVKGEYLAWYCKNLRMENCHVSGTQPLCYADNLVMINCTMGEDADLAFEYSTVNVDIKSSITSVKNPTSGIIKALSIKEIILDENIRQPADCRIETVE